MKILHVIGYFQPELGYEEYYLAKKQAQLGHEVFVLTSDKIWPFPNWNLISEKMCLENNTRYKKLGISKVDGITVIREKSSFEFWDFIVFGNIKKNIENIKPDIIHIHEPRQGFYGLLISNLKNKFTYRVVTDIHEYELPNSRLRSLEYRFFRKRIIQDCFKNSDKILPMTKQSNSFVKFNYKVNVDKILTMTLGADEEQFYLDDKARLELRNKFNIREEDIVLIFTGKISKTKRIELLIEVIDILKSMNMSIKLFVVGSGDEEYLEKLKKNIKNYHLEKDIIFIDFVKPNLLYQYYNAADVGVWPSSPTISILEALACGLPISIPNSETVNHIIQDNIGNTHETNVESIKNSITKIIMSKLNRRNIRENFMNRFSYIKIAEDTLNIYKQLLE